MGVLFYVPAIVCCVSHPSAHVRALSTSVLRDFMYAGSVKPSVKEVEDVNGIHNPAYQYLSISIIDWKMDIGKCLMCEANNRHENGMSAQFLDTAARELGCTISV
ncbi:hypothetical protein KY290_036618 [Solanum tuberosum]|uniref:Uncharacterized protein n=1 Tax=Solanum tuberosum TaxID=4113 RepID=A0ABQ7TV72_SOLTU|nr:hypothetical protein KY289_036101 [Solanum tuberosum]KAH0639355.1 hypothetical protein KY285_035941 [Solanum tuberosum]KAH0737913.1 hypothetical protein KY290_036618 [Solanum tuberosum]